MCENGRCYIRENAIGKAKLSKQILTPSMAMGAFQVSSLALLVFVSLTSFELVTADCCGGFFCPNTPCYCSDGKECWKVGGWGLQCDACSKASSSSNNALQAPRPQQPQHVSSAITEVLVAAGAFGKHL